jgi:NTE family protein
MFIDDIARRAFGLGGGGAVAVTRPAENGARRKARIGLALGGGAARGWAHIGVIRALEAAGVIPDIIAGSSIGAVVGGCHAAGKLDALEEFARSLSRGRVMGLLDFHIGGSGLIAGERVRRLLERDLAHWRVEALPMRFVTIATELGTGHEIWLDRGPLVEAMRASYALPGVFNPVRIGGRWLMDGALVNPIPITAARALGADVVICVNLNDDVRLRGTVIQSHGEPEPAPVEETASPAAETAKRWDLLGPVLGAAGLRPKVRRVDQAPGLATVVADAFNITQDRIARSRLAGDPPDVMIAPKLGLIGLFEFHRAVECIELGQQSVERALPDIRDLLGEAVPRNG